MKGQPEMTKPNDLQLTEADLPVYVDNMRAQYRGMIMCHMVADSVQELLEMADKIGVNRKWFQPTSHPHFDVCLAKRHSALKNGAIEVDRHGLVAAKRRHREKFLSDPIEMQAFPLTRQQYVDYRGWDLPADENGADEGYLVEYMDGGKSNHPDHEGYISWSPAKQFEAAYQSVNAMNFGHALAAIKSGKRVARKGWNGKDMFVFLVPGSKFTVNREPLRGILGEGVEVDYRPHLDMKAADDTIGVWVASSTDLMADDWFIVD